MNTNQDTTRGAERRRTVTWRVIAGAFIGALLLSGCAMNGQQFIFMGDQASGYNREILQMSLWPLALSILIFLGVSGALFYTVNRFREDRHDAAPQQFHGNNRLEVVLVLVPVVIVLGLSVLAVRSLVRLNTASAQALSVEAVGRQFWWQFSYPTSKVAGGVVTNGNEMVMPTKQRVSVTTSSLDVVHGFWAPNIGGQRASIPGSNKTWEVDTDRQAVYQGNCSQLCGASHSNMRYKVIALDQDRWTAFINAATAYTAPTPEPGSAAERGYTLFTQGKASTGAVACSACHRVQGTSAGGQSGPDLSFFGTRRTLGAGMWEAMTPRQWEETEVQPHSPLKFSPAAALHAWIKHSPVVKPGSLMPRYDGGEYKINGKVQKGGLLTDAEIDDIAAYLRTLKLPEEADYWRGIPVSGSTTAGGNP
nr:cytochrome c oxidase subunit II [Deinococcus cavernae]